MPEAKIGNLPFTYNAENDHDYRHHHIYLNIQAEQLSGSKLPIRPTESIFFHIYSVLGMKVLADIGSEQPPQCI